MDLNINNLSGQVIQRLKYKFYRLVINYLLHVQLDLGSIHLQVKIL